MINECPLCSSIAVGPYINVNSFQYFKCQLCGCVFLLNRGDSQVEGHLGRAYKLARLLVESKNGAHNEWLADLMKKFMPKGRVLEVGCGAGFFLRKLAENGYDGLGIDLGEENPIFAKYFLGLTIYNVDFLQFVQTPDMDWIVMNQLLEHVTDPRAFIQKAFTLLKPGGHILVTTPNLLFAKTLISWCTKLRLKPLLGDAFSHPPNHCVLFEPGTMKQLWVSQGFQVLQAGHNPTGWMGENRIRRFVDRVILSTLPTRTIGPNFYMIGRKPEHPL